MISRFPYVCLSRHFRSCWHAACRLSIIIQTHFPFFMSLISRLQSAYKTYCVRFIKRKSGGLSITQIATIWHNLSQRLAWAKSVVDHSPWCSTYPNYPFMSSKALRIHVCRKYIWRCGFFPIQPLLSIILNPGPKKEHNPTVSSHSGPKANLLLHMKHEGNALTELRGLGFCKNDYIIPMV